MHNKLIATAAVALVLQGCAKTPSPQVATEDLNEGIAKTCTPSQLDLPATATATIAMTNDGWCAVRTKEKDGKPFALGLLRDRPAHGQVVVQQLGGETRLEYYPAARFVGTDKFSVALRSRTSGTPDATVQVAVNVSQGEAVAAPEPAPAAAAPARTTTPRATTTTRPAQRSRSNSSR